MRQSIDVRKVFITLWAAIALLKLAIAWQLPLFVDEAFYWQEGQHLSWAYSDLPGLTAWLIRLGVDVAGGQVIGVRWPFLLMALWLPWLVVRIGAREVGEREGWIAGCAALLLPLFGTLGVMALPDVAMALATLLCLDACTRLLRGVQIDAVLPLAMGLAIGALSHYRFIAVIGAGLVALLLLPRGREALRDARVWVAVAFGAAAWVPLLAWNIENAEAGLRFQLVDRHPWAWHLDGVTFAVVQAFFVTPLLFVALLWAAWSHCRDPRQGVRLLAISGALVVLGFFALGFFADTERVSFHWPLPGYLALLPLLPLVLARWPRWLRAATWTVAVAGFALISSYYFAVSQPAFRQHPALAKWYPSNFAGWDVLATEVKAMRATMPADTLIVADNFKIGAELGFALDDPSILVFEHPLNTHHGRAPQLQLWGLQTPGREAWGQRPVLMVISSTDVKFAALQQHYQHLCEHAGALPVAKVVNVDHGAQRFLLVRLDEPAAPDAACATPVLAHIDRPGPMDVVGGRFQVEGWAVKDVVGVAAVTVTLDGRPVAEAEYGRTNAWVATFLKSDSRDPSHPRVGFVADVDVGMYPAGQYWLGLEIRGKDGTVERWSEHPVVVGPSR